MALARNNIVLTKEQQADFMVSNSELQAKARSWMKQFFKLVGDRVPNSFEELHLDSCFTAKGIHTEYVSNMKTFYKDGHFLSYTSFNELWDSCFPQVKLRVFKQVSCFIYLKDTFLQFHY